MMRVLLLLAPFLAAAVEVTPVQQVLNMLGKMKAKGKIAMEAEAKVMVEYEKWVDDETIKLTQESETATARITKLVALIEKADTDIHGLKSGITELDKEMNTMEADKKASTKMREEEHAEYLKVSADYQESIDALAMAIQALKQQNFDRPQAMLQLQKMAAKTPGMRRVLAVLLETDETKAHGGPDVAAYEFQSEGIIEVLEKLHDKFQTQLAETETAETNQAHAYDLEVLHLDNLMTQSNADREEKAAIKAKLAGESATAKEDLADTKEDLAEDQKALSEMKVTFSSKKSQFEANQEVRQQELEALDKAMEIISNPDVAESYEKHIKLVQLPTEKAIKKLSFLQERSQAASSRALARGRAIEFLKAKAEALSSDVLKTLAAEIAKNPFAKVIDMIKELLAKLKEEAAAEADHKAWCDKELNKNKLKRERKASQVSTLTAEVDNLESTIQSMAAEIAQLSKEQAELAQAMAESTEWRQKEKTRNTATIKDAAEARDAVKQALVILKDFYSSQAFLQMGKQAPEMAAYKGMQGAEGGVIGMLEVIETDFARLETETKAEEDEAARSYDSFMSESKAAKKMKHDHEFKLSLKKDQSEFDLSQTKKSLK
jgi:outer membrane murein-binding lipoprotein Lpp